MNELNVSSDEIIVWGAGKRLEKVFNYFFDKNVKIKYFVDSDEKKQGVFFYGIPVFSPKMILKEDSPFVCVSLRDDKICKKIVELLVNEYAVKKNNVFVFNEAEKRDCLDLDCKRLVVKPEDFKHKKTTIIFDCYFGLGLGGVERWICDLSVALIKRGFENIRIITDDNAYDISEFINNHVDRLKIGRKHLWTYSNSKEVYDYLVSKLPCIVITSQPENTFFVANKIKNKVRGAFDFIKVISTVHCGLYAPILNRYLAYKDYADYFICVSQDARMDLISGGMNSEKVLVMSCPVGGDEQLVRNYSNDRNKPIKIGYAARLEIQQKRVDLLVLVIKKLVEMQVNFHVDIAGNGTYLPKMKKDIKDGNAEAYVDFLGVLPSEKMAEFWKSHDIFLSISDYEGRSISQVEAMMNGAVPVVTRVSGVMEDIEQNNSGFIVNIGDWPSVVEKIIFLEENRALLQKFGNKAHDAVYEKSKMTKHIAFWENLLKEFVL